MKLLSRTLFVFTSLMLLLGACSSDTDADSSAGVDNSVEEAETATTTTPTTAAPTTSASQAGTDAVDTDDATEPGTEPADEVQLDDETAPDSTQTTTDSAENPVLDAAAQDEFLEQFVTFMGIEDDLAGAVACIREEAENDGVSIDDLLGSDAIAVAALRCRPDEVKAAARANFAGIESSSIAATPEQIECSFDATFDFVASIDLGEADSILSGDASAELVENVANECGLSTSDAEFLLNEA